MTHDVRTARAIASPSHLQGQAPAPFRHRSASEVVAFGTVTGISVGTVLSFGLIAVCSATAPPLPLAGATALVLFGSTASGALLGGACAALNSLAVGVANRLHAVAHQLSASRR